MLKENDILKNKYRILLLLGQGGTSKVWLAEDLELKKKWAVKEMDKNSAAYKNALNRDGRLTEIEILNCLDSPFAPRIVDSYEDAQMKCVVMDYVEGRTLASMLEDGTIPKDPEILISWTMDICSLLSYLHRKNIVYRDMKPANIILTADGSIKVVDYGIAKYAEPGQYQDEAAVGTRGYAAPEQYRKMSGPKSDIYSVCITLYQLLTGIKKPEKLSPASIGRNRGRLPEGLIAIIEKGCEEDPENRFESMDALRNALSEYESYDENRMNMLRKKLRRARLLKTAAATLFILGLLLFTIGVGQDSVRYKRLVSPELSGREMSAETYIEAAGLKPYSPTACEKLLEFCQADGLTSEELQAVEAVYTKYARLQWVKTKSYADLSAKIALSVLCSTENPADASAALSAACPYLKNCCETKFAAPLVKGLYAMAGTSAAKREISAAEAGILLDSLAAMTESIGDRFGKNVNAENLRLYLITVSFLKEHFSAFSSAGQEAALKSVLTKIQADAEALQLEAENELLRAQLFENIAVLFAGGEAWG